MPNLAFRPDLMSRRRSTGGGAPPTLSEQMEALLFGTNGIALDPTDLSTMWQDDAKTTPVTADGQSVGAISTKWGTTSYDFLQATAAARPLWASGKFLTMDGIDDFLSFAGSSAVLQNATGAFIAARYSGTANNNVFFAISTATATSNRMAIQGSTNRMRNQVRRLDADAVTDNFGTTGAFSGSTWSIEQDYSTTGNAVKRADNVQIDTFTIAGTPANSENTASTRMRISTSLLASPTMFQTGNFGRMVALPFVPTAGQRTTIESWLTEV